MLYLISSRKIFSFCIITFPINKTLFTCTPSVNFCKEETVDPTEGRFCILYTEEELPRDRVDDYKVSKVFSEV